MLSNQEYHVVIRPDAKHLPEVAEGHRSICLEPEVSIVVSWCQVTALTASKRHKSRVLDHIQDRFSQRFP